MKAYSRNGSLAGVSTFFNTFNISNESQASPDDSRIIQAVLMSCMISVTGTGNALVILGFIIDKKLRTPSNYFILNLAISDFFTGTFSLPLYLQNYIINKEWVLGKHICKLWLTVDYTLCQCTVYNIVLISCDRFLAVTRAVKYRDQQKIMKLAFVKMLSVWIIAFLNFGPAIIIWEYVVGYSVVPDGECNPEFNYTSRYSLYSSIFDFFTPMTAIAFFNLSIYFNIRSRMKIKVPYPENNSTLLSGDGRSDDIFVIDCKKDNSNSPAALKKPNQEPSRNKCSFFRYFVAICEDNHTPLAEKNSEISNRAVALDSARNSALSKDKKIAKLLALLVCTFCICWAPYAFLTIISEFFCDVCVSPVVFDVTCWLFFFNSSINPFLYPFCHPAFKKTLMQLFCLRKHYGKKE
ncbi:PREDICTED: histamine H3 receptor-like [Nanorana parkeri]|uniref:histamine H3 receptor-like n=1 Tax=Nanorana parkeri TaxID=125878 RepID=UPI000854ED7D|nr:PREDICTED: histamine H3 receptor-like [Nanorana parkeri]